MKYDIVDTRPYCENKNKNKLLFYVEQIITQSSELNQKIAQQSLRSSIIQMLENKNYLGLSVALSLAPSRQHYEILFHELDNILLAQEGEYQFIVMPLIMVLGSTDEKNISLVIPKEKFQNVLQNIYGEIINDIHWMDSIILVEEFSRIKADEWYIAKKDYNVIVKLLNHHNSSIFINSGYQVELGFLVGYGPANISFLIDANENIMSVMQFWNEYFIEKNITPFINPLLLNSPLQGLVKGSYFRKKMALYVFVTNAIRNLKLVGYKIAVVIGTKIDGILAIRVQALEENSKFTTYCWSLTFSDQLSEIIDDIIHLLRDCLVDHIWILKNPITSEENLPNYHQSMEQEGMNPNVDYC